MSKAKIILPVSVSGEARERLNRLKEHLTKKHFRKASAASVVEYALMTCEAIEINSSADITLISKKDLAEIVEKTKETANAHLVHAVRYCIKKLTGENVEFEADASGKFFTLKHGNKTVSFVGEIEKSALELERLGLSIEPNLPTN